MIEPERWAIIGNTTVMVSSWGRFYCAKKKKYVQPHIHKSRSNMYWRINIGPRKFLTHILVASHFCHKTNPELTQVEHGDNNTLNHNAANLKWVTQSENQSLRWMKARTPVIK